MAEKRIRGESEAQDENMNINECNAHPRDANIKFVQKQHKYYFKAEDGTSKQLRPVTSVIDAGFGHVFDTEMVIFKMMKGAKWKENPLYGKTAKEIAEIWAEKAKATQTAGTRLHAMIEDFYIETNCFSETSHAEPEFVQFMDFHRRVMESGAKPYRCEWCIYDEDKEIAGTIDMVYENQDGTYTICDWKRTLPVDKNGYYEKPKSAALEGLADTKAVRYGLQVSAYRAILESKYDCDVSRCIVVHCHPELQEPQIVFIGREYEERVAKLLAEQQKASA